MSKKGTSTFVLQRASAVLLIPIAVWLLINLVSALGADYAGARAWLGQSFNGALIGAFVVIGAMHMRIGMAEIIVDYIHSWAKDVLLIVNWLVSVGVIAVTIWAVYTLSFSS